MKEEQCGTCLTLKATPRFHTSLQQFRGNSGKSLLHQHRSIPVIDATDAYDQRQVFKLLDSRRELRGN
jgi:hypothetical protein